jgi:hypothetical protein
MEIKMMVGDKDIELLVHQLKQIINLKNPNQKNTNKRRIKKAPTINYKITKMFLPKKLKIRTFLPTL